MSDPHAGRSPVVQRDAGWVVVWRAAGAIRCLPGGHHGLQPALLQMDQVFVVEQVRLPFHQPRVQRVQGRFGRGPGVAPPGSVRLRQSRLAGCHLLGQQAFAAGQEPELEALLATVVQHQQHGHDGQERDTGNGDGRIVDGHGCDTSPSERRLR
jgi:hypothetical protein